MLVCHCAAVNDRTVRDAIARGARDLLAVADDCGAGAFCGGCQPTIVALLAEAGAGTAAEGAGPSAARRAPFRMVVRAIEEDVLAAGWVGGQALGDAAELAHRYGCTRSTLQRAVWVLEQHGVVTTAGGEDGQVLVGRPTARAVAEAAALHLWSARTHLDHLVGARLTLEGAMAEAAAAAGAPAATQRLGRWLEQAKGHTDPRGSALEFHLAIAEATGNPAFAVLAHTLIAVTRLHRGVSPRRDATDTAASLAEHRAVAEAVLRGDSPAARAASDAHIAAFYRRSTAAGPPAEEPERPTTAGALARRLARAVQREGLRPGQLLGTQQRLRERHGVADEVLRQAVTLLEYYAVAHQRVGGEEGVVVSSPDPWPTAQLLALYLEHAGLDTAQLFAVRRPLELAAVARAARAVTPAGIALLRERLAEEQHVQHDRGPGDAGAGPHDLHVVIAEASGDPVIRLFVDALKLVAVRSASTGDLRRATPGWGARLLGDHQGLVEAVASRDPDQARERMAAHLQWLSQAAARMVRTG